MRHIQPKATLTDGRPVAVVIGDLSGWLPPRVLAPWLGDLQILDGIRRMSAVTGLDLIHLGTVAGQTELANPAAAQPLATALAIVTGQRLLAAAAPDRVILAAHGVGEIAAAVLARVLPPETGLELAVEIGRAHAETSATTAGGQVAVLGGYPPEIEARAAELNLSVAAYNGAGEIVLSGSPTALDQLQTTPPRHTRIEPLPAAVPFASHLMVSVAEHSRQWLSSRAISDPQFRLLSGVDGCASTNGRTYLDGTTSLLTGHVHWDLIMDTLVESGVQVIMELPPAGVLAGLASRGAAGVTAVPVRSAELLANARDTVAKL
jgi:[acyl-carrier-protein] S-malonyltransferase